MVVGSAIGMVAGWYGGRIDAVVMQVMDVLLAFPSLILGLIVVAMLGPSHANIILAIALTSIPPFARIARAPTIALKEREFVEACRALGYSDAAHPVVHILPNIFAEILVMGSLWLANAIRTEASLAFIGLGVKPPTPTWGGMIRDGFENILDSAWLAVVPGIAILIVIFALNLLGDGLRDAVDPKLKNEAEMTDPAALSVQRLTDLVPIGPPAGRRSSRISRFELKPRETLAIVGESGSGKSVTALSLMRLVPRRTAASQGTRAARRPRPPRRSEEEMRQVRGNEIAMIFQEPMTSLNPVLTIGVPDRRGAALPPRPRPARAAEAEALRILERVRIPAARDALERLSAPVLRRHAPARDDRDGARLPAEGADRRRADHRARRHGAGRDPRADQVAAGRVGMSVLFITHDMGVVAEIADRVLVMWNGDKVEEATTATLFASSARHPTPARCSVPCRARLDARRARAAEAAGADRSSRPAQIASPARR